MVWLPIWLTFLILGFLVHLFDSSINFLPMRWQPDAWLGMHLPGIGILFSLLIIFLTGLFVSNFFGQRLLKHGETWLGRIPVVGSIYFGSKKVTRAIMSSDQRSFRKVFLLEYPRKGVWTFVFQTAEPDLKMASIFSEEMVVVYVPTTPNPTSGFLLWVPLSELIPLDMQVDEALKFVISLGIVQPAINEH